MQDAHDDPRIGLVLVGFSPADRLAPIARRLGWTGAVFSDPDRRLYRRLGIGRAPWWRVYTPGTTERWSPCGSPRSPDDRPAAAVVMAAARRALGSGPGARTAATAAGTSAGTSAGNEGADRSVDVLIVGAGQAGLGTAHWLRRLGLPQVRVVDSRPLGQSWLDRWDSLRLFTPRRFSALPGLAFPDGPGNPSREEMAGYLRTYATRMHLPVQSGVQVSRLTHDPDGFTAATSAGDIRARHVVVATGPFQRPFVPDAAAGLDPEVSQLHSADYRRPDDVPPGGVLVVGGGNSAAQLALELSATHAVTVASSGPLWFLPERVLGVNLYWWLLLSGVLNASSTTRVSRYVRRRGDAIVGGQLRTMVHRGQIRLIPQRVVTAQGKEVTLADGTLLPVSSVLWCTGFRPDTSWIQIPGATDASGAPIHRDGASPVPGLHWMGLPWQTRLNSGIVDGVDRDAHRTARRICRSLDDVPGAFGSRRRVV